jgi:hypothetical protein
LRADFPDASAAFGFSVALSADWLAVGAPLEDREPGSLDADPRSDSGKDDGAVYLYHREGTEFRALAPISGTEGFGSSLSLLDHELAVGTPFAYGCGTGTFLRGAAFLYSLDPSRLPTRLKCLEPSDKGGVAFGRSVALSPDMLSVGAPFSTGRTIEPNGPSSSSSSSSEPLYDSTGSVYFFRRTESGGWDETPCAVKAPNLDTCDALGWSVATGNGFIVTGAPLEDGRNGGVGSDGNNNDLLDSGAFYVYTRAAQR